MREVAVKIAPGQSPTRALQQNYQGRTISRMEWERECHDPEAGPNSQPTTVLGELDREWLTAIAGGRLPREAPRRITGGLRIGMPGKAGNDLISSSDRRGCKYVG